MKDKDLLIKAIEDYSTYTPYQRIVLKALVALSVNDVAAVTPAELAKLTKMTRAATYYALKRFEEDGVLIRIKAGGRTFNTFRLDNMKLGDIIATYKNKSNYFDNI